LYLSSLNNSFNGTTSFLILILALLNGIKSTSHSLIVSKSLNKNFSFRNFINKSILDCLPETLPLIPSKEKIMLPFNLLSIRNFLKVNLLSIGFLI